MLHYSHVVLALELDPESDQLLLQKAKELVDAGMAVTLVHAVEHVSNYGAAYGVSVGVDIEETLAKEARKSMKEVGEQLGVDESKQVVKIGPAKFVILDEAKNAKADLIVIGSHGRHGLRLLLGSTANAVLHGAECDVLAVRVQE